MTESRPIETLAAVVADVAVSEFRDQQRVVVPRESVYDALRILKQQCGFDLLVDLTCVDYLYYRSETEPQTDSPRPVGEGQNPASPRLSREGQNPASPRPLGEGQGVRAPRDRFGLVYLLANTTTAQRLTVRTFVNDPEPTVPSVVPLWEGANWLEREVWDLFGIHFAGHPDLRRIVLPEEFTAHPLRKDYPLQGRGERHNLPVIHRADN